MSFSIGRRSYNDHVLEWKKEDFEKAYSGKDEKGNLINNANAIYKEVQAYKRSQKTT